MEDRNEIDYNPFTLAVWWRRLLGTFIDTVILVSTVALILVISNDYNPNTPIFWYIFLGYYILLEGIFNRTIGKFVMGTFIINGRAFTKPTFGQIIGRTFLRLIPFDPLTFFANKPLGWHDTISNTMVVNMPAGPHYLVEKSSKEIAKPVIEKKHSFTLKKGIKKTKMPFFYNRINQLRNLHKGVLRILITGSLLIPFIVSFLIEREEYKFDWLLFFIYVAISIFCYWLAVFVVFWIYEGFQESKNGKHN